MSVCVGLAKKGGGVHLFDNIVTVAKHLITGLVYSIEPSGIVHCVARARVAAVSYSGHSG